MITHVLFDFDGTLVNTVEPFIDIVSDIIHRNGAEITTEIKDYMPNMKSTHVLVEMINTTLHLNLVHDEFRDKIFDRLPKANIKLMPGVEKLVQHLYQHKIPMAISTGTLRFYYEDIIKKFGDFFPKHFDHAVCAWDDPEVVNKKPHPDCYLVAAKRFQQPPKSMSNVLIFEDSVTGLKGAVASGGRTVFLNQQCSTFNDENQETIDKADLIIDSFEKFQPEIFHLPPY